MAVIRPSELPAASSVNPASALVVDSGSAVEKATPLQVVDSGVPLASQAEAEAGTSNTTRMSPLRVSQAVSALGLGSVNLEDSSALAAIAGPVDGQHARVSDGGEWTFSTADLSAPVAIDTYLAAFVPPSSDPTGASGAWVRNTEAGMLLDWFGPFVDAAADHERVQAALDLSAFLAAPLYWPNAVVDTKYPVFNNDNQQIIPLGPLSELNNTLTPGEDPEDEKRIGMFVGEGHPAYNASNDYFGKTEYFTWYGTEGLTAGSYSVTMMDAGDSANFSVGDKIMVRPKAYYRGQNNQENPHPFSFLTEVTASAAGVVTFLHAIPGQIPFSTAVITDAEDNGVGLIRITAPRHGYPTGCSRVISGVTGTTEANGTWTITVIDGDTFDLQSSAFVNPYVSGGVAVPRAITNAITSPTYAGFIRITLTGHGLDATNPVVISGVGGTTEANGTWAFIVIDANTIDLIGSEFVNAYTSGGTAEWGGGYLCNYSTVDVPGILAAPGRFVRPVKNVRMGGLKVRSAEADGNPLARISTFGSVLNYDVPLSETGAYVNGLCFSELTVNCAASDRVLELVSGCCGSIVKVVGQYVNNGSDQNAVRFSERASYNTVDLWFSGDFQAAGAAPIAVAAAQGNLIRIHQLNVPQSTGPLLSYNTTVRSPAITGAADNGSGLIRITSTTTGLSDGQTVLIYGVTGTTEANGEWVVDDVGGGEFDLVGSSFSNAYIGGGVYTRDPGQTQDGNTDNAILLDCDVYGGTSLSRFVQMVDDAGTMVRPRISGGYFHGTPDTAMFSLAGASPRLDGCWFEAGTLNSGATSDATNAEIDIVVGASAVLTNFYQAQNVASCRVNGAQFRPTGTAVATSATTYQIDFSAGPIQTITFSGATFQLLSPTGLAIGQRGRVRLVNGALADRTPTAHANWKLPAGYSWPLMATLQSITFDVERVLGTGATNYAILTPTPPV